MKSKRRLDLFNELKEVENTYIANQNHYKSILGKYITQRNVSIGFNLIFLVIIAILSLNLIDIAHQPKYKAMIFDKKGSYLGVPLTETRTDSEILIKASLEDYITFLYSAPQDQDARTFFVRKVASMTSAKYFDNTVSDIIKSNYTSFPTQSTTITIQDSLPIGKNVWQIDWIRTIDGKTNVYYKSTLSFTINNDVTDKDRITNPNGIWITNIMTQEKRMPNE
ncbi:MAG: VirB8/TrbF family protein [Neisseriaceae bacterium]|jgi:type IV secretory pathway TrbF-like protein